MAELAAALDEATREPAVPATAAEPVAVSAPPTPHDELPAPRRKWPFAAAGAAVLIGAFAIYAVARGRDEPVRAPATLPAIPVAPPVDAAVHDAEPADAPIDAAVPVDDAKKRPRRHHAPATSKQRPSDLSKSRY